MIKFPLLLTCAFALSCTPIYYEPHTHNIPVLEEKGNFNLGESTNLLLNKGEVQVSYALTNHIASMANYMHKQFRFSNGDNNRRTNQMFEGGVGLYNRLNSSCNIQIYGIIGRGNFENKFNGLFGQRMESSGDLTKYALQMSLGYREKGFEMGLSVRPTLVKFSNLNGEFDFDAEDERSLLTIQSTFDSFEHAFTTRILMENITIQFQLGRGSRHFTVDNNQLNTYLTVGLDINLRQLDRKKS